MHVAPWVWIVTLVVAVAFLAVDVFVVGRRPHEPSMREVTRDLTFFIGAALLFCAGILVISGPEYAAQFLGGWLTEYSLSIDNLFVFLIIIAKLKVPRELQQHALEDWMQEGYRALGVMEKHLANRQFFAANRYSIADIALYAYTHLAHHCDYNLARFPAVRDWLARVEAQPNHVAMDWQPAAPAMVAAQ